MRKIVITTLVIVMAITGCGSNDNTPSADTQSNFKSNYEIDKTIEYDQIYECAITDFDDEGDFAEYINSYKVTYDYIDYYNISALLEKMKIQWI